MMRPGLDKPGALPLLALIVFSLLTLVPSLSNIYNIKFAEFNYYARGVRPEVPLISEHGTEFPPDRPLSDPRKSWTVAAQHRPRGNRSPRSSRLGTGTPAVAGDTAPVDNKSHSSYTTAESSFLFSRRARAFRLYVIQQLDDYQFLVPFSNRSLARQAANLDSSLTNSTPSSPAFSIDGSRAARAKLTGNKSVSLFPFSLNNSGLQFPSMSNLWQQACRGTSSIWIQARDSPYTSTIEQWMQFAASYAQDIIAANNTTTESSTTLINNIKEPQTFSERGSGSGHHPPVDKSHKMLHDGSTDAAGWHSSELRGSCMAVVIGLVAGIVWF